MIEPLSLKHRHCELLIESRFASSGDKHGTKSNVMAYILDSGPHKGAVVAYIRYLPYTTDTEYSWQVIKQRTPKDCDRLHYATTKTVEQALQLVMASAYEYVALVNLN